MLRHDLSLALDSSGCFHVQRGVDGAKTYLAACALSVHLEFRESVRHSCRCAAEEILYMSHDLDSRQLNEDTKAGAVSELTWLQSSC